MSSFSCSFHCLANFSLLIFFEVFFVSLINRRLVRWSTTNRSVLCWTTFTPLEIVRSCVLFLCVSNTFAFATNVRVVLCESTDRIIRVCAHTKAYVSTSANKPASSFAAGVVRSRLYLHSRVGFATPCTRTHAYAHTAANNYLHSRC